MARMLIETFLVVFCVQTFGLAHSMDINVSGWYQEGDHVLIKVRWVNATSDVNVYHDSQYYNSPRKQIATCRENGNNENVCVANQEHSEDYVIWGERKRAYLVIEKLSNKTIGKYSFEDQQNKNNNVVIDVQHNRIDKRGADGDNATPGTVIGSVPELVCADGAFSKNGKCIPKLADGDGVCTNAKSQCASQGAICSSDKCACPDGYVSKNNQCISSHCISDATWKLIITFEYVMLGLSGLSAIIVIALGQDFYYDRTHDNVTMEKLWKLIALIECAVITVYAVLNNIIFEELKNYDSNRGER